MPLGESRYRWVVWDVCDSFSTLLILPFQHVASLALSCYCLTTFDNASFMFLFLRFAVMGPILGLLSLLAFPFAKVGYLLWIVINFCALDIQPFRYTAPAVVSDDKEPKECPQTFTFCTANVILAPEFIVRINNNRNVYWRVHEVARRLLRQDPDLNLKQNLSPATTKADTVLDKLPSVDVILLQEVFERQHAKQLLSHLQPDYPYCLYDVAINKKSTNCFFLGSGLFLASRYPILDASFHPYKCVSHYGILVSLGLLMTKLDLGVISGKEGEELRAVGYVANTHTQAYQGKEQILVRQMDEMKSALNSFIALTHLTQKEVLIFSVVGGDLNADNISPGDQATREHSLYQDYCDPCRECPGTDRVWAVGTEHRQLHLASPLLQDTTVFRSILVDDVERRRFMIDADVKEQTTELMRKEPRPNPHTGKLEAIVGGGGRRIDQLMLRVGDRAQPVSVWFSAVMASLSDHVPVVMMIQRVKESK